MVLAVICWEVRYLDGASSCISMFRYFCKHRKLRFPCSKSTSGAFTFALQRLAGRQSSYYWVLSAILEFSWWRGGRMSCYIELSLSLCWAPASRTSPETTGATMTPPQDWTTLTTTIVIKIISTTIMTINTRAGIFVSLLLSETMRTGNRIFGFDWNRFELWWLSVGRIAVAPAVSGLILAEGKLSPISRQVIVSWMTWT